MNEDKRTKEAAARPDETTVESRQAALAEIALDVEEFIAAASDLPRDYIVRLIDVGALDDALVDDADGGGIRPWGLALLYAVDELGLLVEREKITNETAAGAWTELRPQLQST